MKIPFAALVAILTLSTPSAFAEPMSCLEIFQRHAVHQDFATADEQSFRTLLNRIDTLIRGQGGPNADNELRKILNDDVQTTLVKMTEIMNGEDRMIDDLLQGRRTLKNLQSVKQFGDALSEFQQLRSAEMSLSLRVKRLIPGFTTRRLAQLRSSIPLESIALQGMKADVNRDVNLLYKLKDATSTHLEQVESQIRLVTRLVDHLTAQPKASNPLQQGLMSSVELEAREQIANLRDMSKTAKASIADLDVVITGCQDLLKAIDRQLYVTLPRVATATQTPGLQSGLNGIKPEPRAIDVAGHDKLAIAKLDRSESEAFRKQKALLDSAKSEGIAVAAFEGLLKLQTPELVGEVKHTFSRRDSLPFFIAFLKSGESTVWKVNMSEAHDMLIERLLETPVKKPLAKEVYEAFESYSKHHEFEPRQKERLLKVFLNTKLHKESRRAAVVALLAFPEVSLIEQVSVQLASETDSAFVDDVRRLIENRRKELESQGGNSKVIANALARDVERAYTAQEEAAFGEIMARLREVQQKIKIGIRKGLFSQEQRWLHALKENPHPKRKDVIVDILEDLAIGRRSFFSEDNYGLSSRLKFEEKLARFVTFDRSAMSRVSLVRVKTWLRPTNDEGRIYAVHLMLDAATQYPVDGLREAFDEAIAKSKNDHFQQVLLAMRLKLDRRLGDDSLSETYRRRFASLLSEGWPKKGYNQDTEFPVARTLLSNHLLTDADAKKRLIKSLLDHDLKETEELDSTLAFISPSEMLQFLDDVFVPAEEILKTDQAKIFFPFRFPNTYFELGMKQKYPRAFEVYAKAREYLYREDRQDLDAIYESFKNERP